MSQAGDPFQSTQASEAGPRGHRIGCVSYLNSKPLIHGIEQAHPDVAVRYEVPSGLLDLLERNEVDIALCPVIDFQRSAVPLQLVPVGGICCQSTTLTVRLFSRLPIDEVRQVHADTDSHTSVALLTVLLKHRTGHLPTLVHHRAAAGTDRVLSNASAVLLIGDKVVTQPPPMSEFPHQWDLGEAWREMTGLPFVFASWMARANARLGTLPTLLWNQRLRNAGDLDAIVARYAPLHQWPVDLAKKYLGGNQGVGYLEYDITPTHLQAIERFWSLTHACGLITELRPMRILGEPELTGSPAARP